METLLSLHIHVVYSIAFHFKVISCSDTGFVLTEHIYVDREKMRWKGKKALIYNIDTLKQSKCEHFFSARVNLQRSDPFRCVNIGDERLHAR